MRNMNKNTIIAIAIAIVLVGVLFGGDLVGGIFTNTNNDTNTQDTNMKNDTQLQVQDLVVGTGDVAVAGKQVTVHYTGLFTSGEKFDSSRDRGTPFAFTLRAGQVIKGWDIGVEGMKVGGKRLLTIPPELAYGPNDYQSIPGNSTLIFEVELLEVK